MATAKCTSKNHEDRDAIGRFRIINFFTGGQITYLCKDCAEQYGVPDDLETERYVESIGWKKTGAVWVHPRAS